MVLEKQQLQWLWPSYGTLGYVFTELIRDACNFHYSCGIYNSQELELGECPLTDEWIVRNLVHLHLKRKLKSIHAQHALLPKRLQHPFVMEKCGQHPHNGICFLLFPFWCTWVWMASRKVAWQQPSLSTLRTTKASTYCYRQWNPQVRHFRQCGLQWHLVGWLWMTRPHFSKSCFF